jgi:hypothetical protein
LRLVSAKRETTSPGSIGGVHLSPGMGEQPVIVVRGPTIIALLPLPGRKELQADPDTSEALQDFQLYVARALKPLRKAGIDFHQVYSISFRVRAAGGVITLRHAKLNLATTSSCLADGLALNTA